jgi:hypothetical protein
VGVRSAPPTSRLLFCRLRGERTSRKATNHKATRHRTGNCTNSLAPSVRTTNRFLQQQKKIRNGDYEIKSRGLKILVFKNHGSNWLDFSFLKILNLCPPTQSQNSSLWMHKISPYLSFYSDLLNCGKKFMVWITICVMMKSNNEKFWSVRSETLFSRRQRLNNYCAPVRLQALR